MIDDAQHSPTKDSPAKNNQTKDGQAKYEAEPIGHEPPALEEEDLQKAQILAPASSTVLHRLVIDSGVEELNRSKGAIFWSAVGAGVVVCASLVAEAVLYADLPNTPWRELVSSLGYALGFILVILGSMQLFTESTITASLPLFYQPSKSHALQTGRLWALVIIGNMTGTALCALVLVYGHGVNDVILASILEISAKIVKLDGLQTFRNAIPAGFLIAILVWVRPNAGSAGFWCILVVVWLVCVCGFTHSVVGSCEAFVLLFSGKTDVAFTFFTFLIPAILGNAVGGALIFGFLVHAHVVHNRTTP